jgi:hypothetical protein
MAHLTLAGLSDDGKRLLLVDDSGGEFTLVIDAKLRAAIRGEHARIGQLEINMDSAIRPRDIQARIRAGESPEAVAQAAQTTVDRIMAFAAPVMAERAHVADRAQRSSVRRKSGESGARTLGEAVAAQLRGANVDPTTVEWDAWRREDGRWTLVADYRPAAGGDGHAEFVFDAPGRYVVPEDDEARRLVGEAVEERLPGPAAAGRRLSAVPGDEELPLGEDAIGMVNEAPADEATEDLSATAAAVRATGDADWIATQASERPAPVELGSESDPEVAEPEDAGEAAEEEPAAEPEAPRRSSKKGRRASVPSWDEIMFGGGKRE